MASDETVTMEWYYTTPCGACGKDVRISRDGSKGKARYNAGPVKAKCASCGHEEVYKPTAIDNKSFAP